MDKNSVAELVQKYISIWNASDDQIRRAIVDDVFTPNAVYTDPNIIADGTVAISRYISAAQKNFTGMTFVHGPVLTHHDATHFSWQVGPPGGPQVVSGFDVALFEGGRISRLYGFFNGY